MNQFYLQRRDEQDLNAGSREAIYRAYPCVGVFPSEEAFLAYLAGWHLERYGPSEYLGIKDERMLDHPIRIGVMNYEVVENGAAQPYLSACDMVTGQMGYIVGGSHDGHLVWMSDMNRTLFSLTDAKAFWSACNKGGNGSTIKVRLLKPGEVVHLRGK